MTIPKTQSFGEWLRGETILPPQDILYIEQHIAQIEKTYQAANACLRESNDNLRAALLVIKNHLRAAHSMLGEVQP